MNGTATMRSVFKAYVSFMQVWPLWKTVFPDFTNDSTNQVWKELILDYYNNTIKFDGLWLVCKT